MRLKEPAFEELVGNHGGLGGPQTESFLLYPSCLPLDRYDPIIGGEHLHHILKHSVQSELRQVGYFNITTRENEKSHR